MDQLEKALATARAAAAAIEQVKTTQAELDSFKKTFNEMAQALVTVAQEVRKTNSAIPTLVKKEMDKREENINLRLVRSMEKTSAKIEDLIRQEAAVRAKEVKEIKKLIATKSFDGQLDLPPVAKALDGTWKLITATQAGRPIPKEDIDKVNLLLHLHDSKARIGSFLTKETTGSFFLSGTGKSWFIDINLVTPLGKMPILPLTGKKLEGACEVDGETLRILMLEKGRPTVFDPVKYSDSTLLTFQRLKKGP